MILPIYIYGCSVLRKEATALEEDFDGLEELIKNMYSTMYNADGVGIAAPQVGVSKRIFVVDASPMEEDEPGMKDFKHVFINPVIIEETGDEWKFNEGCLSIPGIREDVSRKEKIVLEYYDEHFELHTETFEGIKARIIQHEYDHLNGRLFTDKINPLRKRLIGGKLKAMVQGKMQVPYKAQFAKKK